MLLLYNLIAEKPHRKQVNYTMKVLRNQLVLPLNFEILIDENDPVWKLTEICDGLDYTRLYDEYLRHWRTINPVILFEILVFAYMNGIYSSRAIEHACKTDVRFMWLLQGQSAPDHATGVDGQHLCRLRQRVNNLSNFNRAFKMYFGKTPSTYRKG